MSQAAAVMDMLPRWTKRVRTESSGKDPLGLSRVAGSLTDYLLQGIITQTSRARYYSFYTWALWHIQRQDRPTKYAEYLRGFRRREAFMALATLMHDPKASPVGVNVVGPKLQKAKHSVDVDTNFKVLPSNDLGGYGQYYGGSLHELGLTKHLKDGTDDASEVGELLADAYELSASSSPYIRREFFRDDTVSLDTVKRSASAFTLDEISKEECSRLRSIFFALDVESPTERALLRRHTLALILDKANKYSSLGAKGLADNIPWRFVYAPHYFGQLWINEKQSVPYVVPDKFATCHAFWQQFSIHQFLAFALENVLYSALEILSLEPTGLTPEQICARLLDQGLVSDLERITTSQCRRPEQLLAGFGILGIPDSKICRGRQREFSLLRSKSELRITSHDTTAPATACAVGLALLASLYAKWRTTTTAEMDFVASNAASEMWAGNVLPVIDSWLSPRKTWAVVLEELIRTIVLDQHDRIMYEKGRLGSRWVHRVEGRIVKDEDYQATWRSSRHGNCIRILCDLGLLRRKDSDIQIAGEGKHLLKRLVQE